MPSTNLLASCTLPTMYGDFAMHVFGDAEGQEEVVALVHGTAGDTRPLVRLHSACFTGDILGSLRCDCGPQLTAALQLMAKEPHGILLYLTRHEGRGIGLANKVKAYELQERGLDTVAANVQLGLPADARDYTPAVRTLLQLGVRDVRLATNNPQKIKALAAGGLTVERVPHGGFVNPHNTDYLRVKDILMGHLDAAGTSVGDRERAE
ncbi:GTP cyclohydrolase II [Actinocrinis puniceicyclus]|uniref:GTP cyclohydrolase-2 n=1 Tax=Actinocrinis puniceicyclus TaxID=977794 RepID=A0A8J8BG39_9ACTN|nr:GTP cyclohydrolase II [Actinocrinis puniceicyclus]MBS2966756.1 GTP cyclohydrolase II [Actinocrinis puniceicyclus]